MGDQDHPLLSRRFGGAFAVISVGLGLGVALMTFGSALVRGVGMMIAVSGAAGGAWIYWDDLRRLRLRIVYRDRPAIKLQPDVWVVLIAIFASAIIPAYIWVWLSWPTLPPHRVLTSDQQAQMRPILEGAPNYVIQINSIASCEECEDYAVELRRFFSSLRGWSVNGGPLIFPIEPQLRNGITFSPDIAHDDLALTIVKAFNAAHVEIARTTPQKLSSGMSALILVGKQSS